MQRSLLAVFAHPDDEAFGTGGALARYAAEGVCTYLICATRGEVGEISDPDLATPETLGAVREGELRCAAETIERHPGPFTAQSGSEIEAVGEGRLLVRAALLTTEVQLADGNLHYWRFKGWHTVFPDCPEVRPDGE